MIRIDQPSKTFGNYLRSEPGIRGRVLDIGCGHTVNRAYEVYADRLGQLDGVQAHFLDRTTSAQAEIFRIQKLS
jgi:hypothetical protein